MQCGDLPKLRLLKNFTVELLYKLTESLVLACVADCVHNCSFGGFCPKAF